jgi:hypothetical protein
MPLRISTPPSSSLSLDASIPFYSPLTAYLAFSSTLNTHSSIGSAGGRCAVLVRWPCDPDDSSLWRTRRGGAPINVSVPFHLRFPGAPKAVIVRWPCPRVPVPASLSRCIQNHVPGMCVQLPFWVSTK